MKYIALPDQKIRRLSFYLAMEEFIARHMEDHDYFFLWQVEPSVIFGRHQIAENEINLPYCRENNIQVYRRKSGGGCVYADRDNLMLSYVTRDDQVNVAFNNLMNMELLVLNKLGITAASTSRNDVMIGDKKVSGAACYCVNGRSIVHSTLLYDTNMQHMLQSITPSKEKMRAQGIESVRQRITLLKDYTQLSLEELKDFVRETLCTGEYRLTQEEVAEIERIEQSYLDADFLKLIV